MKVQSKRLRAKEWGRGGGSIRVRVMFEYVDFLHDFRGIKLI